MDEQIKEVEPETRDLCGWHDSPQEVEKICQSLAMPYYDAPEPDKSKEVFLYKVYEKVYGGVFGKQYQKIGDCVSWGHKWFVDFTNTFDILINKANFDFEEVSSEVIYALSRIEIGHGQIRGDGSVGAWAAKALNKYGVLSRKHLERLGLNGSYDPNRAKQWGNSGLPDNLEPYAAEHTVMETMSLVRNSMEAAHHIQQGRPVTVCSDVGFENGQGGRTERDSNGFATARNTWGHCMCFIGVRWAPVPALLIINQWQEELTYGGRYPSDQPNNSWWVDFRTADRMLGAGDSWTGSKYKGYPSQSLDWIF